MTTTSYQCFFDYFGLSENPFHVSPDPRFYYSTFAHDSALNELQYGLHTRQGLLVLTGEAGVGKTMLLNNILESLEQRKISTAYVFHPLLEPAELFEFILRDFGVSCESRRKGDLLRTLHEWLIARDVAGDLPVVIIDEAQSLSSQALDELRLLLNLETARGKLLQIILVGQSELEEKLRRPELRQLRQRVLIHCRLPLFSEEQTVGYIGSRLSRAGLNSTQLFPAETLQVIHEHSRGIPRLINLLCEHALITAYGEQQKIIAPDIIQGIAVDFDLSAKPISVENDYSASKYGRLISFPAVEPRPVVVIPPAKREPQPEPPPERASVQAAIDEALLAAAAERAKEIPVPPRTLASQTEVPTFWGHSHSRFRLPEFIRNAAVSFREYWRQVVESFVRDLRYFMNPLTLPAQGAPPARSVRRRDSQLRNLIIPIASWLRHPITHGHMRVHGQPDRPASSK